MQIFIILAVVAASVVALPAPRRPPPLMTEIMDTATDGLGELGGSLNDLGVEIWDLVSDVQDYRECKRIIRAAAEEARYQVEATNRAEDFSKARQKIEEQTWKAAEESLNQEKASAKAEDFSKAHEKIEEQTRKAAEEEARKKAEEEARRKHEEQVRRNKEEAKKKKTKKPDCWKLEGPMTLHGGWDLPGGWDLQGVWDLKGPLKLSPCEK